MLTQEDQQSVKTAMESRLEEYFDSSDDFWGTDWLAGGFGSRGVDATAATNWLMKGVEVHRSIIHG